MPSIFDSKPMSTLWTLWEKIPVDERSKDPIAAIIKHVAKQHHIRFAKSSSLHDLKTFFWQLPSWKWITDNFELNKTPEEYATSNFQSFSGLPVTFGIEASRLYALGYHEPVDPRDYWPTRQGRLYLCRPGGLSYRLAHDIRFVLYGTIMVLDWDPHGDQMISWNPRNPVPFLERLKDLKVRVLVKGSLVTDVDPTRCCTVIALETAAFFAYSP